MTEPIYNVMKNWIPRPAWRKKRIDGDFLLLSSYNLDVHYLNSTAKEIVELIGERTIDQICSILLQNYDVEPQILHNDIIRIIRDLQWKKLIRVSKESKYL